MQRQPRTSGYILVESEDEVPQAQGARDLSLSPGRGDQEGNARANRQRTRRTGNQQARYWILTIPQHCFVPWLPPGVDWICGQLEQGETTQYCHWQFVCCLSTKRRLTFLKQLFGPECHCEPTRSAAANDYVRKEETAIPGTQFELGVCPFKQNSRTDWDHVKEAAKLGNLDTIPSRIFVTSYRSLTAIAKDYQRPPARHGIRVRVYWGVSRSGKSFRAFQEATENGQEVYLKNPITKWWDGYQGEENVIIDEFRGVIDIANMLRWLDWTPCSVETKGGSVPLKAKNIWITSNIQPIEWYLTLDEETRTALLNRLHIVEHFEQPYQIIAQNQ